LDGFFVLRWNEKFLWILFVTPFRSFLDFDFDNFLCICIWYEYEYELVYGLCYCYLRVCLFEFFCTEGVTRKRGVHEWEGSTWDPVIEAKTWKPRLSNFFVSLSRSRVFCFLMKDLVCKIGLNSSMMGSEGFTLDIPYFDIWLWPKTCWSYSLI
jgi:hypothetical protein